MLQKITNFKHSTFFTTKKIFFPPYTLYKIIILQSKMMITTIVATPLL